MTDTESHAPVLTTKREEYDSDFTYAVRCQDMAKLEALLKENPEYISQPVIDGKILVSPLSIAVNENLLPVVKFLIGRGADVNVSAKRIKKTRKVMKLTDSVSPLHIASRNGSIELVQYLIECGADINKYEGSGATPLYYAGLRLCEEPERFEIIKLLCIHGADVNKGHTQFKPLELAVSLCYDELTDLLLHYGANPNLRCPHDLSVLNIACKLNCTEVIKILLMYGANPDTEDPVLLISVANGNLEAVKLLLQYGADPNRRTYSGASAIYIATIGKKIDIIKELLAAGAIVDKLARMNAYTPEIKGLLGILVVAGYIAPTSTIRGVKND